MNKISYKFQGHDLTAWAEYGGLPVWHEYPTYNDGDVTEACRLIAVTPEEQDGDLYTLVDKYGIVANQNNCRLRYSKLEDIIDGIRDDYRWFFVLDNNLGVASHHYPRFFHNGIVDRRPSFGVDIPGHLFDPEQYPDPINLKDFREGMK